MNLIYPPKCGICGKICKESLCKKCEKKIESNVIWEIKENQNPYIYFEELISIFKYEGIIRDKIIDYKFNEKSYLYKTFTIFLLKNKKVFEKIQSYDTIIPVPISEKRKKTRGYNQSLLISREISKKTGIKLQEKNLIKIKNTIEQSKLDKEEREKNVQNVYQIKNEEILKNKKILLLDDIYTTGNTVNSCCKILKKAKPKKIGVIVIAKD